MESVNALDVLERLKIASKTDLDTNLAALLGLSRQSVTKARATKSIPAAWIPIAAKLFNVSTDWLFFGCGPMQPNVDGATSQQQVAATEAGNCLRCTKLEIKVDTLEKDWRELCAENRQCAAKIEQLLRENGDLRERCARLEERQACGNVG